MSGWPQGPGGAGQGPGTAAPGQSLWLPPRGSGPQPLTHTPADALRRARRQAPHAPGQVTRAARPAPSDQRRGLSANVAGSWRQGFLSPAPQPSPRQKHRRVIRFISVARLTRCLVMSSAGDWRALFFQVDDFRTSSIFTETRTMPFRAVPAS